jgi:DNA-binding transcriptional ArsR family regulator
MLIDTLPSNPGTNYERCSLMKLGLPCKAPSVIILNSTTKKMEAKETVLEAMKKEGEPVNAGKITEITGLDRKEVDKAMKALKEENLIVSPKRCYWEPKQ